MNAAACLGKPLGSNTPMSVVVPPTSTTRKLLAAPSSFLRSIPAKNEAPWGQSSQCRSHQRRENRPTAHRVSGTRRKGSNRQFRSVCRACKRSIVLASEKMKYCRRGKSQTNLGKIQGTRQPKSLHGILESVDSPSCERPDGRVEDRRVFALNKAHLRNYE